MIQISNFWGELTGISASKASLFGSKHVLFGCLRGQNNSALGRAMILFSKLNKLYMGYYDPIKKCNKHT